VAPTPSAPERDLAVTAPTSEAPTEEVAPAAPAPATPAPAATPTPEKAQPAASDASAASAPVAVLDAGARDFDTLLVEARKLGYRRAAEAAYLKALAARPGAPEALSALAMMYLNQGKNAEARERAKQAVTRDAQSAEGWIVLGAAESSLGDQQAARAAYGRCAALPASSGKYVLECKRMLR